MPIWPRRGHAGALSRSWGIHREAEGSRGAGHRVLAMKSPQVKAGSDGEFWWRAVRMYRLALSPPGKHP